MRCIIYCGDILPVTNIFDINGDDTEDREDAYALVAVMSDGQWLALECRPWDILELRPH